MMIDEIINNLRLQKEIDDWKIIEKRVDGSELFFVKDALDMNRSKQTQKFFVTIYHDFEENGKMYRGSSEFTIYPGEIDVESLIKENIFSSKFVKNTPYPLATPSEKRKESSAKAALSNSIDEVVSCMYAERLEKTWINSSEIFMNHIQERIVNSKGVDVSNDLLSLYVEFVTTSRVEKEEVELYWSFQFSKFDDEIIKDKIANAMKATEDRSRAVKIPDIKDIPVILTGESVKEFFKYHLYKVSARYIYEHLSNAKVGMDLQNNTKGDRITMWIDPFLERSSYSVDYDEDGFPAKKVKIIDNSVVGNIWGGIRYAHYLGIEPTGHMTNFVVEAGKVSEDDLQKSEYLKILSFSDFGVDPMTGDFGGEIRLGWYSDGERLIPVTGGSISGNVSDVEEIILSKETQQEDNFFGPKSLKISGLKISGSKEL